MTAASSPPPRDGEVCECLTCGCVTDRCQCDCCCRDIWRRPAYTRPAAPSEPPAETQQGDGPPDEALVRDATRFIGDRIATWEQNFDAGPGTVVGLPDAANAAARWHLSLTSRPSADAETLRDALRAHHPIMRSETGPFSGCRCGQVKLGQDVIHHVVTELSAALDAR